MFEIEKYQPIEQLHSWSGGVSYKAHDQKNDKIVDLRIFKYKYFSSKKWNQIAKKLLRLFILDNLAAQKILDLEVIKEPYFVAFEYVPRIPLWKQDISLWNLEQKIKVMTQITQVISNAHRFGITHNILSPSTTYMTKTNDVKIDFSQQICSNQNHLNHFHQLCTSKSNNHSSFLDLDADIYSMGMLFSWLITNKEQDFSKSFINMNNLHTVDSESNIDQVMFELFLRLITQTLSNKLSLRPNAAQINNIAEKLWKTGNETTDTENANEKTYIEEDEKTTYDIISNSNSRKRNNDIFNITRIGRFEIIKEIGQGGMGVVYEAKDTTDNSKVALKIILPSWAQNKEALQRFYKEARLLSEVNNPYVSNLLEINQENDIHYIVMELVSGQNLQEVLQKHKLLSEKEALFIICDIVRALLVAHEKGILHRDIKPANIILAQKDSMEKMQQSSRFNVENIFAKLSDFGLARHVIENDSLDMTKSGAILGTPKYMSPEQCKGEKLDIRSDIYSVGATLFHLVTGQPPFQAQTALGIMSQQLHSAVPSPKSHTPGLSDNFCHVIEKSLAKEPEERYQNMNLLLKDLESLLSGKPTELAIHPQLPKENSKKLLHFSFEWLLESTPKELWPHVTNTERVNKAIGLVAPKYFYKNNNHKNRALFARNNNKLFPLEWQEHPYEWLHEKRMSVLREYNYGLFNWMASIVELHAQEKGTLLVHKFVVSPRTFIARILLKHQFKNVTFKKLKSVYSNIDNFCINSAKKKNFSNAFEEEPQLSKEKKILLQYLIKKSTTPEISQEVAKSFQNFLEKSSSQDVARIRPLSLARRNEIDEKQLIHLCLNATKEGLLTLLWDIICPLCRIPSDLKGTLQELKTHGHCEACNIDYELDFANSVELIFSIHKSVREADLKIYCIGGPAHSPHVVSQVKLKAKECLELNLKLAEGSYILRSPQLANTCKFDIYPEVISKRQNIQISKWNKKEFALNDQHQCINLINDFDKEIVIRLEHTISRQNVLTAAYVSSLPIFRKLFPQEVLSPKELVSISNLVLLGVEIYNPENIYINKNDSEAFNILYTYFQTLEEFIEENSGVVIKTTNEGIVATFPEPEKAVITAVNLQKKMQQIKLIQHLGIRVVVNKGAAMVATINNRLDYFGITLKTVQYLLKICKEKEVVLSCDIAQDVKVSKALKELDLSCKTYKITMLGKKDYVVKTQCLDIKKMGLINE